ncbi:MAG TPA: phosphoribosylanthranilate isomerase [Pseudonocardiaceae bacterium]|nr:phosphoribosylanthranilate isomerase [Pseudonocardiaceae bacterium]
MSPRVKICGIRSEADLTVAVRSGVDAVGFICGVTHRSEDALAPEHAAMLVAATPPYVSTVLVTHLELAEQITGLAELLGVDTIQVHGLVNRKTLREVFDRSSGRWRITRTVHVTGDESVDDALRIADSCHAVHLDSRTADRLGGTGRTHDWSISRKIVTSLAALSVPVILSGGLRPNNVTDAVEAVQPYAVDVNSGVENQHGDKDLSRSLQFVNTVRQA